MTDLLRSPLQSCASLLGLYRQAVGGTAISRATSGAMVDLYEELARVAGSEEVNGLVTEARDALVRDNLRFGFRRRDFVSSSTSSLRWAEEVHIVARYGISEEELREARRTAQKVLARKDPGARHPLSGPLPLSELLGSLQTLQVASIGVDQERLAKSQRKQRAPIVQADYLRLRAAIFLLANAEARQSSPHVFRLSYALAVADACV